MYAYLRGTLSSVGAGELILEVSGVGYRLQVPVGIQLPAAGERVTIHTSQVVREGEISLYGFASPDQRDLFETLTLVSGVGPKLALALLGHLGYEELTAAIGSGDLALLSRVPGVGRRTAERLTVDLRGKMPAAAPGHRSLSDALGALMNLGYSQAVARRALEKASDGLPGDAPLSDLVTAALKHV